MPREPVISLAGSVHKLVMLTAGLNCRAVSQVMLCEQQLALNSELTYRAFSGLAGGHALKHQDWLSARRLTNHLPC